MKNLDRNRSAHASVRRLSLTKNRRHLVVFLVMAIAALTIAFAPRSSGKLGKNLSRNASSELAKRKPGSNEPSSRSLGTSHETNLEADATQGTAGQPVFDQKPKEVHLVKSGRQFNGDLRLLPRDKPKDVERPEHEGPEEPPLFYVPPKGTPSLASAAQPKLVPAAPAPTPLTAFDGLGRPPGNGFPPDTNGDVGPNHYIQTINTSIGIYNKTGVPITSFSFNTFMSQGSFGNLCDTNNFGDPVVVYDTFEDRWIITDFAFILSGGNPAVPVFQCFAVSQSGDPVGGGWNFYSLKTAATAADAFNDYPKFGIWPDGLYMSSNMFAITGGGFTNVRVWAFNKAQMYAGAPTIQILSFDA